MKTKYPGEMVFVLYCASHHEYERGIRMYISAHSEPRLLMRNGFSFVVRDSVPPVWNEARWTRNPFGLRWYEFCVTIGSLFCQRPVSPEIFPVVSYYIRKQLLLPFVYFHNFSVGKCTSSSYNYCTCSQVHRTSKRTDPRWVVTPVVCLFTLYDF